jgi:hypothetical protein
VGLLLSVLSGGMFLFLTLDLAVLLLTGTAGERLPHLISVFVGKGIPVASLEQSLLRLLMPCG